MSELNHVVATWVSGWARSRGMPVRREGRTWRAEVDDDHRSTEWVVVDPEPYELEQLAEWAQAVPRSWVTVVGAGEMVGMTPLARGEHLMRTVLGRDEISRVEGNGVEVELEERDGVAFATVHLDGMAAARGQVALAGTSVVIDKIVTEPEFRRRGLGRAVMSALTAWSLDQGAVEGLLIASEDGVLLYSALGWKPLSPIVTFR